MSFDLIVTLGVALVVIGLFASERLPLATTALLATAALLLTGVVTVQEAFSGFSNRATVTVAAMFVLSAGLSRTGAMSWVGRWIGDLLERRRRLGLAALILGTATLSAFINNTAVVAVMLPIVVRSARQRGVSPSKLLIPLSFAGMFGGTCTLIGTSTNLLVSSLADELGHRPISMFELAPVGLSFVAVGSAYLLLLGPRLLPDKRPGATAAESFEIEDYVADLALEGEADCIGDRLEDSTLLSGGDCDLLAVFRDDVEDPTPSPELVLCEGDVLRVRGALGDLERFQRQPGIRLDRTPHDLDEAGGRTCLVETVVAPQSELVGSSLGDADLHRRFGATVLAVRHRGSLSRERMRDVTVHAGDALLLETPTDRAGELQDSEDLVLVSSRSRQPKRRGRVGVAVAIVVAVVTLAATDLLPIAASASIGAVLMILTGCLHQKEAFRDIDWNVIFLLAGILPLGTAVTSSGAAELIGDWIGTVAGRWGPIALISTVYLVTTALTSILSNNATAVLLTPITAAAAGGIGMDPWPAMMAVALGASTAFATPVGYQTNTLVYGSGGYRFGDFVKVGGPLVLLFWIVATLLVPLVWPP